jgi:polyribonucleotide nucleotidyltransferase
MTKMLPKNTENSYSGWSNYDTWNFKLWLDNDQKTQEIVLNAVKYAHKQFTKNSEAIHYIREFLELYAKNNAPELENSFYSDVLNASIRSVNYYQIADAYFFDYLENYNQIKKFKAWNNYQNQIQTA